MTADVLAGRLAHAESCGPRFSPISDPASVPTTERTVAHVLTYVHLRNIHNSTGAGRVARQLTEQFALRPDVNAHILADRADHDRIVPLVRGAWETFPYHLFNDDTSRQQARWFLTDGPTAEQYWPEVDICFCTAESYVPVRKARLAVTLHDAAYFETSAHRRNRAYWVQRLKWELLYRKISRRADMFHTVSQFSADRLAHFVPEISKRLRVVPNAVAAHFFEPVTADGNAYLEEQRLTQRPYILLPGGLHFRKNAELVLKAWHLLSANRPDLRLVIVNHSHPDYLAQGESFGDSFRALGFVTDDQLRSLYAGAQIVWFPSRYEGFGLPVLEAMACGAPVVTSRASSLPEVAGDAATLVNPDQPGDHVEVIGSLLDNAAERQSFRERGLKRAAQYTWAASAAQLRRCFEELL